MSRASKNLGIVSLWAVAECGFGGIMHAMKIPFTGIVVGSISVVCLYFIALYGEDKKRNIIEATATVLMIKLIASPHSPWQAYVAVSFQALMAIIFLTGHRITKLNTFLFAIITQLESALQRIIIMVLIFGSSFINALEKSINQILSWIGMTPQINIIWSAFSIYVLLHLVTGIILGYWLPTLESEVESMKLKKIELSKSMVEIPAKKKSRIWIFTIVSLLLPLALAWFLNDKSLFFVFFRVLIITLVFIFILTPLIKYLIRKFSKANVDYNNVNSIISQLPELISNYTSHIKWASANYSGFSKIKYMLVALLYASTVLPTHEK